MAKHDIDPETLRRLLDYDPSTGVLTWRVRDTAFFPTARSCAIWNGKYAGHKAFTHKDRGGYLRGAIFNKTYLAHRVCWAMHFGFWPKSVDHVNGDTSDNRIENLRSVSHAVNLKNARRRSDNSSGVTGVGWYAPTKRWTASIHAAGTKHHLGYFEKLEDAIEARALASRRLGFHPNHGREARK